MIKNASKILKKSRGVSLMELIIYIGIMSVVIVAITDLAGRLVFAQKRSNASTEVTDTMNLVSAKLNSDISNATVVTGSLPGNSLTLTVGGHLLQYALIGNNFTLATDGGAAVSLNSSRIKVQPVSSIATIFSRGTNGEAHSISYKINFSLLNSPTSQNVVQTTVLMRGK